MYKMVSVQFADSISRCQDTEQLEM